MLTKTDLSQIRDVVREEVDVIVKNYDEEYVALIPK